MTSLASRIYFTLDYLSILFLHFPCTFVRISRFVACQRSRSLRFYDLLSSCTGAA